MQTPVRSTSASCVEVGEHPLGCRYRGFPARVTCGTWDETLMVRWLHGTRIRPADFFDSPTVGKLKSGIPKTPAPNHGGFDSIRQSPHDRSSSVVIWWWPRATSSQPPTMGSRAVSNSGPRPQTMQFYDMAFIASHARDVMYRCQGHTASLLTDIMCTGSSSSAMVRPAQLAPWEQYPTVPSSSVEHCSNQRPTLPRG